LQFSAKTLPYLVLPKPFQSRLESFPSTILLLTYCFVCCSFSNVINAAITAEQSTAKDLLTSQAMEATTILPTSDLGYVAL